MRVAFSDHDRWPSGAPVLICRCAQTGADQRGHETPQVSWSPDGKFVYIRGDVAKAGEKKIFAIPLKAGEMFPPLPPQGINRPEHLRASLAFKQSTSPGFPARILHFTRSREAQRCGTCIRSAFRKANSRPTRLTFADPLANAGTEPFDPSRPVAAAQPSLAARYL